MGAQGLPDGASGLLCPDIAFCASGAELDSAFLFHAHKPSIDDHDDFGDEAGSLATSLVAPLCADSWWGDGAGIAFEAIGVRLWFVAAA